MCTIKSSTNMMKYQEPPSDFRTLVHIYLCGPVLEANVPPYNGESASFGSVSHNDNAHRSLSLSGASGYSRSPLADLFHLVTYCRVDYAIGLSPAIRLYVSWPLLD